MCAGRGENLVNLRGNQPRWSVGETGGGRRLKHSNCKGNIDDEKKGPGLEEEKLITRKQWEIMKKGDQRRMQKYINEDSFRN